MGTSKSGGASQQQLEKSEADTASYDGQINAMKEQVKQFELDLEFSKITSPISGRISRAMLTEGNLVNAGGSDPLLTTIVSLNQVYVYFSVDERTLHRTMRKQNEKEPTILVCSFSFCFTLSAAFSASACFSDCTKI